MVKELKRFYNRECWLLQIYIAHWETYRAITSHTQGSKTFVETFALRYTPLYPKLYIIPLLSGSSCDPCALNIVEVIWLATVKTLFIFQNVFQLRNLRRSMLAILWLLQCSFRGSFIDYILLCHIWKQKTCISNVKEAVEMQRKACNKCKNVI